MLPLLQLVPASVQPGVNLDVFGDQVAPILFGLGWITVIFLLLWIAWETYLLLKMIEYVSGIQWTFLQITIPDDSEETPKSMEIAIDVWGGIHKGPDLVERYFDGYLEAWYSCEIFCTAGKVMYVMVVPTAHRKIFEGVIYGQYPRAEIREVEDYSQRYNWRDLREKFDLYGSEITLVEDDIYPIKTYQEYETKLAEEDRYVDPHQSMIEAFTHVGPGEEFWVQILIRPMDAGDMKKWSEHGEEVVREISGQAKEKTPGIGERLLSFFVGLPGEIIDAFLSGPTEVEKEREKPLLRFFNPVDEAKMKGILQKVSHSGYKVLIRGMHIAPLGQLQKPNIGRLIGAFKQFNTFHLNSLQPDSATKTNGPNYFLRDIRRKLRERTILLKFQWRDMFGLKSGQWMTAEELATLYHFPVKYVRAPGVERAKSGRSGPPENLPYA